MPFSDPEAVQQHLYGVTPAPDPDQLIPEEGRKTVGKALAKILPRAGAQTAGAEAGALIGAGVGAITPIPFATELGAALGAGIANYAASRKLPPEYGGDPSESKIGSFLWGALPEMAGRGIASFLEGKALRRGAEDAHSKIVEGLREGPMPTETAARTAEAMGRPEGLMRPPVLTGEQRIDAVDSLQNDIMGGINAERRRLGEPIGKAYDALKGNKENPTPEELADLSQAAADVKEGLISPAPQAQAIFGKIKRWTPEGVGEDQLQVTQAELNQMPPEQRQWFLSQMSRAKPKPPPEPPTLDDLRQLRQVVNEKLRSAKGSDVHALANLQQALDEHLLPHLPEDIGRDRQLYRGFIQMYPWREINRVKQMKTTADLSKYVFDGPPERAAEIIHFASPKAQGALREALTDHVMRGINPDLPLDQQMAQVHKALGPYIENGTAARLYGERNVDDLRELAYAPIHREQMAEVLSQPKQHEAFLDGWVQSVKGADKNKLAAAQKGYARVLQSLPPAEQAKFVEPPVPGATMPVLPTTQEALASGLEPGKSRMVPYAQRRMAFSGPQAAVRIAATGGGGAGYAVGTIGAFATILASSAAYKALMENGGAGVLAKVYASPTGRAAARNLFEGLAAIGTQTGSQMAKGDEDTVEVQP